VVAAEAVKTTNVTAERMVKKGCQHGGTGVAHGSQPGTAAGHGGVRWWGQGKGVWLAGE
jgi:hypothetical protein